MYQKQVEYLINLMIVGDGLIIIASGYIARELRMRFGEPNWSIEESLFVGTILFVMFLNSFVMGHLGLYSDRRTQSLYATIKKVFFALFVDFSLLSLAFIIARVEGFSRLFLVLFGGTTFVLLLLSRILFEYYVDRHLRSSFNSRKILLVGEGDRVSYVASALGRQKSWGHEVIGYLSTEEKRYEQALIPEIGKINDFEKQLSETNIDEVIFALPPKSEVMLTPYISVCEKLGLDYRIIPAMYDPFSDRVLTVESIQNIPTLMWHTIRINPSGLLRKRILDYAVSSIGMIFMLITYPFIALAIKIDSPGPIFFKQPRMGQNGRIFHIYKFRTMYIDAETRKKELLQNNEMQGLMFKMENDPRITKVGRFLRKTSLDEFPQFINVMRGEMSVVGTRPPTLDEVSKYELWHRRRVCMKPGITGLWQVSGRNKITDFNEVVRLDLEYIDTWSLGQDIGIIIKTIKVVFLRTGAK